MMIKPNSHGQRSTVRPGHAQSGSRSVQGIAIVSVLLMIVLLSAVLVVYMVITMNETRTEAGSRKSFQGFYAAEGGLNLRAEQVRSLFVGFNQPSGTSPTSTTPCTTTDTASTGTGDFACITYPFTGRSVRTYVQYSGTSSGTVTTGTYSGLTYQQYAYDVHSLSYNSTSGALEDSLEMTFQSRLVPLFQFAAFYKKDLEFQPGANMTLSGRVHTNSNLYLNANSGYTLQLNGITSAAGTVSRSGKDGRSCNINTVYMYSSTYNIDCSIDTLSPAQLKAAYGGKLLSKQPTLTVPTLSSLAPVVGNQLWDQADVRIVVKRTNTLVSSTGSKLLSGSYFTPYVEYANGIVNTLATTSLWASGAFSMDTFYDYREGANISLFQLDQQLLMNNIVTGSGYVDPNGSPLRVTDTTGGGLVWNISFDDSATSSTYAYTNDVTDSLCAPASNTSYTSSQLASNCRRQYGVKILNASTLGPSSSVSSSAIAGLSIVSNQPVYLHGDFNKTNKKPASIMADAINIVSTSVPTNITYASSPVIATPTTVNAAFLSGIDDTIPGSTSGYNGGLQNYMRFHENWSNVVFTYNGSFVSLGNSKHVNGGQTVARYNAPTRAWSYDTDFNDASKLPPLTPRLIYLRQLLFSRNYN